MKLFYGQEKESNEYFSFLLDFRPAEGSSVTHIFLKDLKMLPLSDSNSEMLTSRIQSSDTYDKTLYMVLKNSQKTVEIHYLDGR